MADPHVEVQKLATLVKHHGISADLVNEVLALVKKPTKLADDDAKEILVIIIEILKNKQKDLVREAEDIILAMKKSKSLNWKKLLPEAREMMKVIGELPIDNKDIVDRYEDFLKKLLDLLKKGKALQDVQSSLVELFFNCILVKMPAKSELADECSGRDIMDFSKDASARLDALERCERLLQMDNLPKDNSGINWAVGNIIERITESYDRNGKTVTKKENELLMSIFKTVSEGADTIGEQFYQDDNEDIPNVYLKPWRDALGEYINAHQSSRTLEFVAPIMPNILKWAKIAVEEDHDDFIHWMFSKLHLVGIAPPEEFKDLLPEIVDLMLVSEKYNELFMFISSLYPHNPGAVHDRLQDMLDRFEDVKEGDRGHITWILYNVAQQHPEAFTKDQISSMFDLYKMSSAQAKITLLMVIHSISQKHPKHLADFLPQLCDESIFKPDTMNLRTGIISSVGGLNQDLGQKAVDYLMKYADYSDVTISLIVVGQMSTMVREHVEYMQKHKQKLEKLEQTATQPQVRDMVHDMILELEGKSLENIAEDVQQQQEDIEELDTKVDATIDTVISIGDTVVKHDQEIGELEEGLEKIEERVDDVEDDMDEAKIKIEEIDNKTMSNAPKWSRDLTKLLNPEADNDWRLLASRLGYSNDDIRGWATQHDPCMALLSEWYATHKTSEANYGVLNALTEMDRMDGVAIVENAMKVAEDVVEDEEFEYASPTPVFISYQWGFQEEVKLLKQHLNMAGYECWMDVGQMGGGDKLFAKIDNGIRGAKIVICCVTEKYAQSPNCNREVNLSVNLNKPIIPLLMEKMDWPPKGSMGPIFSEYLFIRFFQRGGEETPENDQGYWPIPKFQELLMQLNFFVVPDQKMVTKEYSSWWAPMVEDVKVDKNKSKKQHIADKAKSNDKQVKQPETSPLVFLSYQWGKQPQVKALYQRLTSLGYSVWMDIYQMGGGDSLYDKIDRGMRGCKAVVSCVTQKYSLSANCRREVSLADALKKPIVPLLLEEMKWPPDGPMSMVFTELLYINFHRDEAVQLIWTGQQFEELKDKLSQFVPDVAVNTERKDRYQRPPEARNKTMKVESEVAISEEREDKNQRPRESQDKKIKPVSTAKENVARSASPNKKAIVVRKTDERESGTHTTKGMAQAGNKTTDNKQAPVKKPIPVSKGVLAKTASMNAFSRENDINQHKDSSSTNVTDSREPPYNSAVTVKKSASGAAAVNSEKLKKGQKKESVGALQSDATPKSPKSGQLYSASVGDEYVNGNINEGKKQAEVVYPNQIKSGGDQKKSSSCIIL